MKFAECSFHCRQVVFLILFQKHKSDMLFFCSKTFSGSLLPEGYSANSLADHSKPVTPWPPFQPPFPPFPILIENSCPISSMQYVYIVMVHTGLWFVLPSLPKMAFSFWGDSICLLRPRLIWHFSERNSN